MTLVGKTHTVALRETVEPFNAEAINTVMSICFVT